MHWFLLLGLLGSALAGNWVPGKNCGKLDMVFVLDRSGSIGRQGWTEIVDTVENIVSLFAIDQDNADVGVISFDHVVSSPPDIPLGSGMTKGALLAAIANLDPGSYTGGGTATYLAVPPAAAMFADGRDDAPDIMIFITDGISSFSLTEAAINGISQDITRIAVGIGPWMDPAFLTMLAGHQDRVYMPADFDDLGNFVTEIADAACGHKEVVVCDAWKWHDASSYKFCRTRMNYMDAKEVCEGMDSYLVEINNAAENIFVSGLVYHSKMKCAWLGANRYNFTQLEYHWETTGETFWSWDCFNTNSCPYEAFAPGQPDGNNWARCVQLDLNHNNNGRWDDENCYRWRTFVCERDCCKPPSE